MSLVGDDVVAHGPCLRLERGKVRMSWSGRRETTLSTSSHPTV